MDTITSGLTWGLDGKVIICFLYLPSLVTHLEHACVVSGKKQIPQS